MRVRSAIALIVAVGGAAGTLVFARWISRCPFEVALDNLQRSVMVDESGLATLRICRPFDGDPIVNTRSLQTEARMARNWVQVTNIWGGWSRPGTNGFILVLVPRDAMSCRVRFNYSSVTPKERLAAFLRVHAPKLINRFPTFGKWLYPPWVPGASPPPRAWTEANLNVAIQ